MFADEIVSFLFNGEAGVRSDASVIHGTKALASTLTDVRVCAGSKCRPILQEKKRVSFYDFLAIKFTTQHDLY